MRVYVLATDARWPLDAPGAAALRALEGAGATPTLWRVSDAVYRGADGAAADVTVVVAKGAAVAPPPGWSGPVCWESRGGCSAVYNVPGMHEADDVSAFLAKAGSATSTGAGVFLALGLTLIVVVVLRSLWTRRRQ